jgi:hypothetical protein
LRPAGGAKAKLMTEHSSLPMRADFAARGAACVLGAALLLLAGCRRPAAPKPELKPELPPEAPRVVEPRPVLPLVTNLGPVTGANTAEIQHAQSPGVAAVSAEPESAQAPRVATDRASADAGVQPLNVSDLSIAELRAQRDVLTALISSNMQRVAEIQRGLIERGALTNAEVQVDMRALGQAREETKHLIRRRFLMERALSRKEGGQPGAGGASSDKRQPEGGTTNGLN